MESDEAPRLKKHLWLNGLSGISFWVSLNLVKKGQDLVGQTILKFIMYVSIIVWINSAFYLKNNAEGIDTETWEFQREQVKLSLWIVGILVLMELPLMISGL